MKIGRNDPCPCGSGKKYKKCCLRKDEASQYTRNADHIKEFPSDYSYIEPIACKISEILKKYSFKDVVAAIFCFNSWRRNRSALAQGLSLNMALSSCKSFGTQTIQSYSELQSFYGEIQEFLQITHREDEIVDDYGEVFINHAGKTYPVIIGTGHQQVYSVLRYMQTLVSMYKRDNELVTILKYIQTIIDFTKDTNIPNPENVITYELPSEDFWTSIKTLFAYPLFKSQYIAVSQILGHRFGPIEMRHFIKVGLDLYPLYNSSLLIDYYKLLLSIASKEDKKDHIIRTIHSLIDNTFNFSSNTPNRVLIDPIVTDSESGEKIISEGIIFAGIASNSLLLAIDNEYDSNQVQRIITSINKLNQERSLRLIEPFYRDEAPGAYGISTEKDFDIVYMLVDPFTDITSHASWLEEEKRIFRCTALDVLYLLGFVDELSELVDFIRYDNSDPMEVFTFGGKSNLFFIWKKSNRLISSGAIEYDHMIAHYNETDEFTCSYFSKMLHEFPRDDLGLFSDPLNWKAEDAQFGYTRFVHKGCNGFGGECTRLGENTNLFLAHNVEFFSEKDFAPDAYTALRTIDELNERLFLRYTELICDIDVLNGKTLQILYMPWEYARKNHVQGFLNDSTRSIVFSDEYVDQNLVIIRYSADPEVVLAAIRKAEDRHAENTYFKELLRPLYKYSPDKYKMLEEKLNSDSACKKTVGVFQIERHYYFSDKALDTKISAHSFARARKEIAKLCLRSGVESGEYRGKEATSAIRKMQLSIVQVFEGNIATLDKLDLHKRVLNYLAIQQNGIILNMKRYAAFNNLDEAVQLEFEERTRNIREDYRRYAETAKYLLESNLVVVHVEHPKKCTEEEFEFLLAFADWLVTLQNDADTCFYTDFDLSISIDSEYKVDTLASDIANEQRDALILRKYNTTDYCIKDDSIDLDFFRKALGAFNNDTGIDISLLISLIEYMQLGIVEDNVATEIYPNIFEVDKSALIQKFNENLEERVADVNAISALCDFITLDPSLLKTIKGEQHDLLPIWEREKRDSRFSTKPIVEINGKLIFSPVIMNNLLTSWKSGITEWYLPYEIGLPTLLAVLKAWKKRYEDEMVQDIAQLFRSVNFNIVEPEAELVYRFPHDNYPAELGDYDVIAINTAKHEIWLIESKVLQKVGSIYEDQMQQKSFFYQHKDDEKFQRRIDYVLQNLDKVLTSFKLECAQYKIIPYMVTNKVFASRYKTVSFPIITYSELKHIIFEAFEYN